MHRKKCERARAKWDKASSAFCTWAIANGFGHVLPRDMDAAIAGSPEGIKLLAADHTARDMLNDAENAAVAAGHAWRGTFGMLQFYSPSDVRRWAAQRRRAS